MWDGSFSDFFYLTPVSLFSGFMIMDGQGGLIYIDGESKQYLETSPFSRDDVKSYISVRYRGTCSPPSRQYGRYSDGENPKGKKKRG